MNIFEKLFEKLLVDEMLGSRAEKTKDLTDIEKRIFDEAQDTWDGKGADYLAAIGEDEMTGKELQGSMPDYWDLGKEEEEHWRSLSREERDRLLDIFYPPKEIYRY